MSSPDKTISQISRCLKTQGIYFGHENNKTLFRPIFDFLMRVFELWKEEAGEHQLMSADELRSYCSQYGLDARIRTCVFLPPHFFNLLPYRVAVGLLAFTDTFFGSLPFFRRHGGTLLFSARKVA